MAALYTDLNPPQRQAVLHPKGPLLILAGAGSGKTRVITHRLAELIHRGTPPQRIFAVTFTNKAASEMRERAERLLGHSCAGLWIGTFHSLFGRLLRIHASAAGLPSDYVIFDDSDQKSLCNQILKELQINDSISPSAILHAIDQAKNQGIAAEQYQGHDYFTDHVQRVYQIYQRRLKEASAVDFGDLLLLPLQLLRQHDHVRLDFSRRFDHVLVDEFQDVNVVQYQLVCHLAQKTRELMVVGDDDQAIYSWRGADVRNLLAFEKDWPDAEVIKLEQNYRSTDVILQAANAVIARNRGRFGKRLFTENGPGEAITCHAAWDERGEAQFVSSTLQSLAEKQDVALEACAVFYRTNAQSRVLEESLRMAGLPYTIIGGVRFYDRAEIRDLIAYLRLCHHTNDEMALRRIINVPARGIGATTLQKIDALARTQSSTLWQALCDACNHPQLLAASTLNKLVHFVNLIQQCRQIYQEQGLTALAETIVEKTGYLERLSLDPSPEATDKRENVMEWLESMRELSQMDNTPFLLGDYLEQIALLSSLDQQVRGVSLMTIHAAKGLEFDHVFVTGMEEGLFPSWRAQQAAMENPQMLEEERRLAYVAITRAKKQLHLTYAKQRRLYGAMPRVSDPSRFLTDIPAALMVFTADPATHRFSQMATFSGLNPRQSIAPPPAKRPFPTESSRDPSISPALTVEYEDSAETRATFRLGQIVVHPQFGTGEVRAFSGIGDRLKLVVAFETIGPKTVLAQFLQPAEHRTF